MLTEIFSRAIANEDRVSLAVAIRQDRSFQLLLSIVNPGLSATAFFNGRDAQFYRFNSAKIVPSSISLSMVKPSFCTMARISRFSDKMVDATRSSFSS